LEKVGEGLSFAGVETAVAPNPKAFTNYDMFFNVIESRSGLRIDCDYNADLYDPGTIGRFIGYYETLLRAFVENPGQTIGAMPLIDESEARAVLDTFNATATDVPAELCIHDLIGEQARRTPGRVAVEFKDRILTFAELDRRANALAAQIQRLIPGRGARIVIGLERSPDMVVALLAVMKAGHTYVPIDPDHPMERLRLVVETAKVSAVVSDSPRIASLAPEGMPVVDLADGTDEIEDASAGFRPLGGDPQRAAYVIFTSGSTGVPKGVEVPHRAVVNFLKSMEKTPGFTSHDTIVAVTTIAFDIAVLELYLPLITGGRTVIANREDVVGGYGLARLVQASKATVLQATPSLWRMLLEAKLKPAAGLKMLCGGEPLPRDLADALLDLGGELWNMYGPTETTVWSAIGRIEADGGRITIGAPIDNTQLYILDDRRQLCPFGVAGNLYIGGEGLATGYFERPSLADEAFEMISLAGRPARRLYRTGDVAVRRAYGALELLGRIDHQVKLRGFRIELEDIEVAVRRLPGIATAAVALRRGPDGQDRLVGFVQPEDGRVIEPDNIVSDLGRALPDYMVPSQWQVIDELPLTPNGKLDRKALSAISLDRPDRTDSANMVAPATDAERQVAEIWSEVLGVADVDTRDSLLSLGADSLQVFRIAARLADRNLPVEAKHLLKYPTIAELGRFIEAGREENGPQRGAKVTSLREFRHGERRRSAGAG
ncbi:MAG: non-ribosomal peptide synthetase, partial [Hyphomicrobiaceae bacterium]